MTSPRRLLPPALALVVAVGLSGACGNGTDGADGSTGTGGAASTVGASTGTSPATQGGGTSPTTTASPSHTSPTASSHACTGSDVTLAIGSAGAAAGHVVYNLTATANAGHSCTMRGYPGVSLVAQRGGAPIGHPAVRVGGPPTPVPLTAGKSATSAVQLARAANYGSACTQKKAAGFTVYLPGQKARLFVRTVATGCTETTIELLQVKPFTR